jgi:hypothetical protein
MKPQESNSDLGNTRQGGEEHVEDDTTEEHIVNWEVSCQNGHHLVERVKDLWMRDNVTTFASTKVSRISSLVNIGQENAAVNDQRDQQEEDAKEEHERLDGKPYLVPSALRFVQALSLSAKHPASVSLLNCNTRTFLFFGAS